MGSGLTPRRRGVLGKILRRTKTVKSQTKGKTIIINHYYNKNIKDVQ